MENEYVRPDTRNSLGDSSVDFRSLSDEDRFRTRPTAPSARYAIPGVCVQTTAAYEFFVFKRPAIVPKKFVVLSASPVSLRVYKSVHGDGFLATTSRPSDRAIRLFGRYAIEVSGIRCTFAKYDLQVEQQALAVSEVGWHYRGVGFVTNKNESDGSVRNELVRIVLLGSNIARAKRLHDAAYSGTSVPSYIIRDIERVQAYVCIRAYFDNGRRFY